VTAAIISRPLIDGFGRRIDYVRLSVTDRCNLRCAYCMPHGTRFRPASELLSIDELAELAGILVGRGVRRIRLTGGEPLVRGGILDLVGRLGALAGLEEVTLTTNGTRLAAAAQALADAGVRRVNVSLDSLDPERFAAITRGGELGQVVAGIDAARAAGIAAKINMVALKGVNDDEFPAMLAWCGGRGLDLTLIEAMPVGEVEDRSAHHLPLDGVRRELERRFTLNPTLYRTGGPARYFDVAETGARVGFITPLSENFCAGCNRIRISATGTVYGCLGHDQRVELRGLLQEGVGAVNEALDRLLAGKPARHDFRIGAAPTVARHMNVTGG
jgi:cyclic pyranopterin phosphate synthase